MEFYRVFLSDNERIKAENLIRNLHFKLRSPTEQARIYLNKLKFVFVVWLDHHRVYALNEWI